MDEVDEITSTLKNLATNSAHYNSEILHENVQRKLGQSYLPYDELQAIYHFTESHALWDEVTTELLHDLSIDHTKLTEKECRCRVKNMCAKVEEMPKEWTIVQVTSKYYLKNRINLDLDFHHTPGLFISVFSCGKNQPKPVCVAIDEPIRKTGESIELIKELYDIVNEQKEALRYPKGAKFETQKMKMDYFERRLQFDNRLKDVVKETDVTWLKNWTSLFAGKYLDNNVEEQLNLKIDNLLKQHEILDVSERSRTLFYYLIKGLPYNMNKNLNTNLEELFPQLTNSPVTMSSIIKSVREIVDSLELSKNKRHPIIIIVDKSLDLVPWEMLPVLQKHPACRMPSLSLTYSLFKQYEDRIKDGLVSGFNYKNGKFIVNPGQDLDCMEGRMKEFFKYWIPTWKGSFGVKPETEKIEDYLQNCDVFTYFGHGGGEKYIKRRIVRNLKIPGVVFLFGCSSIKLRQSSPQVFMEGNHQSYLIASCPCVIGTLWEVTDNDEDLMSTTLLSIWIPSKAETHWKYIDKKLWFKDLSIKPLTGLVKNDVFEPELLRAICKSRSSCQYYITQAACIARGLPVKLST